MTDVDVDVVVAGGGPVGLACAVEARLTGLTVAVLEPRPGPVDKACGEGLMPGAVRSLARLGVHLAGHPFAGIRYSDGRRCAEHRFRAGTGLGVRRTALHAALAARAADLGVTVHAARVAEVIQDRDGVVAGGVRARWLLAADGLHSPVRRALGLHRPPPRGPSGRRYGLRRHFRVEPWSDLVEVRWTGRAELYVTPVAADVVGVAVLGPPGGGYDGWLAQAPEVAARLAGAAPLTPVRGAGPLRQRANRPVLGRVLLVGDASGYVDALTGEGMAVGLAEARAAVAAVAAGRPGDYAASWRGATRGYRWLTTGLVAAAVRPPLRRRVVPAAARAPALFGAAVELLAR